MKNRRIKQFAVSFLVILSLAVSSVSAVCTCNSHDSNERSEHCQPNAKNHSPETKSDEHSHASGQHSHEVSSEHHHAESPETTNSTQSLSEAECCCVQSTPKVFAKNETVKIEKQAAVLTRFAPLEIAFVSKTIRVESEFTAPLYLTDSFYNLSPGRAPPVS